jgi:serine phosphatase RsbU (regulator of sigma subunit)/anti-sigma regulatory factor (Ser/Thr protein kinase)
MAPDARVPAGETDAALSAAEWTVLDRAVARLLESPELEATLAALLDVLVPEFAQSARVELVDEHGSLRPAAESAAAEDAGDMMTVPLQRGDAEIGRLHVARAGGEPFSAAQTAVIRKLAERCAQAIEIARRFERERHVALTFQNGALAAALPHVDGYRFDAFYRAGRAEALVGGDWYDAFVLSDGRLVVSIGDVVGSGLPAAIAMVNVRQALRGVAQVHPDPALMLDAAHRTLRSQHPDRFVTAFVGVIDPVTLQCAYANAGHPPPFVRLPDGALMQPREHDLPLGLVDQHIRVHETMLPPGAMLVLYTDGLIESTKDVLDGERRLDAVLRADDLPDVDAVARRIHDDVLGDHARDDVAILTVAVRHGAPVRRWRFDPMWADAALRVRREARAALNAAGIVDPCLRDVELVVAELLGNAIRYAPGTIELILEERADAIVLHVLDKGPGFAFSPRLPADLYSESGRGLFLISRLAHDFTVERRPGRGSHARAIFTTSRTKEQA